MTGINYGKVRKYFAGLVKGLGDESGMGVVEVVLIIIVLVSLVILFKSTITALLNTLLSTMTSTAKQI